MARPTITRSIKRRRLREMGCDCADAGQESVPASVLLSAAGRVLQAAPRRKPTGKTKSKPRSRSRR